MLLGITLLAVWLIATGLLPFMNARPAGAAKVLNVIAVLAGVLILLQR